MLESLERTPELSIHQPSRHLARELGVQWTDVISTSCLKKPMFFLHDAQSFTAFSSCGVMPRNWCYTVVIGKECGGGGRGGIALQGSERILLRILHAEWFFLSSNIIFHPLPCAWASNVCIYFLPSVSVCDIKWHHCFSETAAAAEAGWLVPSVTDGSAGRRCHQCHWKLQMIHEPLVMLLHVCVANSRWAKMYLQVSRSSSTRGGRGCLRRRWGDFGKALVLNQPLT